MPRVTATAVSNVLEDVPALFDPDRRDLDANTLGRRKNRLPQHQVAEACARCEHQPGRKQQ
jgi:hypothetical protein